MSPYKHHPSPQQPSSLSTTSSIIEQPIQPLSRSTRQHSAAPAVPAAAPHTAWVSPIQLPLPTNTRPDHTRPGSPSARDNRVVFTRQLWRRSMPNEAIDVSVSRQRNPTLIAPETSTNTAQGSFNAGLSRRTSSSVSSRSQRQPPSSPSAGSRTPLTPEESPPFRTTRKRAISALDEDERALISSESSPSHVRTYSDEGAGQVCICQPDPKIPRPRNAFILYRQHHQAKVIADHPGLANPEISKIIGEQWRNQSAEVKSEWKRLAEEEKIRHQQQYPQYRYQPKRNTRRNSLTDTPSSATGEKARCQKCGGRTVVAPGTFSASTRESSPTSSTVPHPQTPTSITTPTSRTLPVLQDLTLQSPAARRMARPFQPAEMSPRHAEGGDDLGPVSPDTKRRRYNPEHPVTMYRAMPPRYSVAPIGTAVSPTAQYSLAHQSHPHPYPQAQVANARRESLPSLHMMSPSGPMGPPPRPGMGYQQHRLSQGHAPPDRSLTLPPLQTSNTAPPSPAVKTGEGKSAKDVIMSLPLALKLEVLRQIAPPAALSRDKPRGPLIAIEGDDVEAVRSLAQWLAETLDKEEETTTRLIEPPDTTAKEADDDAMAEYHLLAASWLRKSKELVVELSYTRPPTSSLSPPSTGRASVDTGDSRSESEARNAQEHSKASSSDSADHSSRMSIDASVNADIPKSHEVTGVTADAAKLDSVSTPVLRTKTVKPVLIAPTYSLHATNVFSCRIPIVDAYGPKEHWQWNATLWRGIIGPDLTIYVRDAEEGDQRRSVEQSESERLFMVKRSHEGGEGTDIESATLRRVGFEVSEWIRAFGARSV